MRDELFQVPQVRHVTMGAIVEGIKTFGAVTVPRVY